MGGFGKVLGSRVERALCSEAQDSCARSPNLTASICEMGPHVIGQCGANEMRVKITCSVFRQIYLAKSELKFFDSKKNIMLS
jgi:hypothetical protein